MHTERTDRSKPGDVSDQHVTDHPQSDRPLPDHPLPDQLRGLVFLARPASVVAPELLGCVLRVGDVAVRLTEVEAYEGERDPASHAWRGVTPRTAVMFGAPGHLYVYLSYGMHAAVNVVCDVEGVASAVLLRAGEVVAGHETVRERRGPRVADAALARGPGNLGSALGLRPVDSGLAIDGDRVDLTRNARPPTRPASPPGSAPVSPNASPPEVATGPRVGVSRAADVPWRFWLPGEPSVSAYKRSPRAPA